MQFKSALLCICCLSLFACKGKQKSEPKETEKTMLPVVKQVIDTSETYFSIRQYFDDQWQTRSSNPYTLLKIQVIDGKRDSSFVQMTPELWASIRAPFDAADISDTRYLSYYQFSAFDEDATMTSHNYYETLAPELFLRKMDIAADVNSQLVKSVYLETQRSIDGHDITGKLQYIPDRIVQIQTFEKIPGKPAKNTLLEYRFTY